MYAAPPIPTAAIFVACKNAYSPSVIGRFGAWTHLLIQVFCGGAEVPAFEIGEDIRRMEFEEVKGRLMLAAATVDRRAMIAIVI